MANVTINLAGQSEGFTITGSAQADTITTGGGSDIIDGGAGNDNLTGGAGIDTFVFHPNFGYDTITDLTPGTDIVQIDQSIFSDFAALLAVTNDVGGHAVITYDVDNSITLNIDKTTMQANSGDFHFV